MKQHRKPRFNYNPTEETRISDKDLSRINDCTERFSQFFADKLKENELSIEKTALALYMDKRTLAAKLNGKREFSVRDFLMLYMFLEIDEQEILALLNEISNTQNAPYVKSK